MRRSLVLPNRALPRSRRLLFAQQPAHANGGQNMAFCGQSELLKPSYRIGAMMTTPILQNVRQRGQQTTRRAMHTGSWLWFRINRRCVRLPAYLWKAIRRFRTEDQHRAIAFSYWGLLSLFPLVLLLVAVDASFHSLWFARQEIFATLD